MALSYDLGRFKGHGCLPEARGQAVGTYRELREESIAHRRLPAAVLLDGEENARFVVSGPSYLSLPGYTQPLPTSP